MRRHAKLVATRTLSPTVRELTIEVAPNPDGTAFTYEAGQYVNLFVPTAGLTMKRAYSIASGPGIRGENRFDIAVTKTSSGQASDSLHVHAIDAAYEVEGPKGGFVRRHPDKPALFIGAGTGLAPLRAMIQDALKSPSPADIRLLFGARDESHMLWSDDVATWQASGKVTVDHSLSRSSEGWKGLRGYVQAHAVLQYETMAKTLAPDVFVCGRTDMVTDVLAALEKHGVDSASIYAESYT
ncbi:MAG TPA: FAD-dependent oxidoreductase [Polyangiaceae bacterium]